MRVVCQHQRTLCLRDVILATIGIEQSLVLLVNVTGTPLAGTVDIDHEIIALPWLWSRRLLLLYGLKVTLTNTM